MTTASWISEIKRRIKLLKLVLNKETDKIDQIDINIDDSNSIFVIFVYYSYYESRKYGYEIPLNIFDLDDDAMINEWERLNIEESKLVYL